MRPNDLVMLRSECAIQAILDEDADYEEFIKKERPPHYKNKFRNDVLLLATNYPDIKSIMEEFNVAIPWPPVAFQTGHILKLLDPLDYDDYHSRSFKSERAFNRRRTAARGLIAKLHHEMKIIENSYFIEATGYEIQSSIRTFEFIITHLQKKRMDPDSKTGYANEVESLKTMLEIARHKERVMQTIVELRQKYKIEDALRTILEKTSSFTTMCGE